MDEYEVRANLGSDKYELLHLRGESKQKLDFRRDANKLRWMDVSVLNKINMLIKLIKDYNIPIEAINK